MKKAATARSVTTLTAVSLLVFILSLAAAGCGGEGQAGQSTDSNADTTATTPTQVQGQKIVLDPNLKSASGVPAPEEMKTLIDLQAKLPYPVVVPTSLPGGYLLDKELIASGDPTERDAVGYYNFRYSDPGSVRRVLTFNQSQANDKQLSGYYLTEVSINGTVYQVYWHETRNYLPDGPPVEVDEVGDAEAFVIVWKGSFTDASGQNRQLFYSLSTGTNSGEEWEDVKAILQSLKPLGSVGQ